MKAPQLIPGASRAWRLTSVWAAALLMLLSLVQADVLPLVQPLLPPEVWPWVSAGMALAIVVLRVIAQPGALLPPTDDGPEREAP